MTFSICFSCQIVLFSFSTRNSSPTVRLIQDIYEELLERSTENKEAILNMKATIHREIASLRNMTYQLFGANIGK